MKTISLNLNSKISSLIVSLAKTKVSRGLFEKQLKKFIYQKVFNSEPAISVNDKVFHYYKFLAFWAMYKSFIRNVDKNYISKEVTVKVVESFLNSVLLRKNTTLETREMYKNKYGMYPPNFITISPTKKCNLRCVGCYATSTPETENTLEWDILYKIIQDAHDNLGMRFFVISGGEPLMYKSNNKTIFDLFESFKDCYFLMYTNGTMITEEVAQKFAALGNVTPAISIEGYEAETNERRGNGVYQRILKARNHLIQYGVPFGFSVTATKKNIDKLLDEKFYDYHFDELGATYMWVFQYMPIGRDISKELMITPEDRLNLHSMQDRMLKEKEYFVADFWNSAAMSNGCISCGKSGGYFYINWDGNIMPCVFIPYYNHNVKQIYAAGKTLADALFAPLFVEGRKWQQNYMDNTHSCNFLTPCLYRDHYKEFYEIAKKTNAKPENEEANQAINSKEYYNFMIDFDNELGNLSEPKWEQLKKETNEAVN